MQNERKQELGTNVVLFALNSFGSKLFTFLLIPLYAAYMSKSQYGTADLVYSTVTILVSLLTLKISSAVLRFAMDEHKNQRSILKNALLVVFVSSLMVLVVTGFLVWMNRISVYYCYVPVLYALFAFREVITQYIKAIGKTKIYALDGIITTVSLLAASFILLGPLKLGVTGYLSAALISHMVSLVYLCVSAKIRIPAPGLANGDGTMSEMLKYSVPLLPNALSRRVIEYSDRYMVAGIIGSAANGIYTMSYKIPGMMGVFSDIFMQAWLLTVIEEYETTKDYDKYRKLYSSYEGIVFVLSAAVIVCNRVIAKLLYGQEFYTAYLYAPLLVFALVFSNLEGFFGSFCNAEKKTRELFAASMIGAVLNVIVNAICIPRLGIYGAIIGTCVSSIVIVAIRIQYVQKHVRFTIEMPMLLCNACVLLVLALNETFGGQNRIIINFVLLAMIALLNLRRMRDMITSILAFVKDKVLTAYTMLKGK